MKKMKIQIASRGSKLALFQAEKVLDKLKTAFPQLVFEIHVIKTKGDKFSLARSTQESLPDQGIFTKEIDEALLKGEVQLAVHSAKDLPTQLLPSLKIGAILERDEVRDAWLAPSHTPFSKLPQGSRVGTSSPRRKAQILRQRPDLQIVEMRGNVPTRVDKMKKGLVDGLILAACGLIRLGLEKEITEVLDKAVMLPAVSQGAIAVEIKKDNTLAEDLVRTLNHEGDFLRVEAERSLLRSLEGGCQVPIGVFSDLKDDILTLEAQLFSLDGARNVSGEIRGNKKDAQKLGQELANKIKRGGGSEMLAEIRKAKPTTIPSH